MSVWKKYFVDILTITIYVILDRKYGLFCVIIEQLLEKVITYIHIYNIMI